MKTRPQNKYCELIILTFLIISLNACSHYSTSSNTREQLEKLISGEQLFGEKAKEITLPNSDFLKPNEEMRKFTRQLTSENQSTNAKILAILNGLFKSSSTPFKYTADKTLTASEAFTEKAGNCLSFSALFVTLAREAGLTAKFNTVDIPITWGEQDDHTYILYKHINTSIKNGPSKKTIVDVTQGIYKTRYAQSTISDRAAEAQFYNNLATEHMVKNDIFQAFRYLKKGLSLSRDNSYLWSNLATLYHRENLNQEAEQAFLYAIQKDPKNLAAISSLQRLYKSTGEINKAIDLQKKAETIRLKNPYFQYRKAIAAFRNKNYEQAIEHIIEAINRLDNEPRFHLILGASQLMLGQQKKGTSTMARAIELADNSKTKARYKEKLKLLKSIQ